MDPSTPQPAIYKLEFADTIVPQNSTYPFYYTTRPSILPQITDKTFAVWGPIIAYWVYSLLFHALDTWGANWKWLAKYRIHESAEVKAKNIVSRRDVVLAVLVQQAFQVTMGYIFMEEDNSVTVDHTAKMRWMSPILVQSTLLYLGDPHAAQARLQVFGPSTLYFIYWWLIPTVQMLFAFFLIDTWQYFLHRYFHTNKFLYRNFHSWHHRLYVPYAYGALYNHPLEGVLFDSSGAVIAQFFAMLSLRQAIFLFMFSTFKTVDDHCGYSLPFDPLQLFFSNNADYHDIHHQSYGIKKNFSQPFFVHWDAILGTRLTRKEVLARGANGSAKPKTNGTVVPPTKEKVA